MENVNHIYQVGEGPQSTSHQACREPRGCMFIDLFAECRINLPFLPGCCIRASSSKQVKRRNVKPKAILADFQLRRHLANPVAGGTGGPRMAVNIPASLGQDHRQGTGRWDRDPWSAAKMLQRSSPKTQSLLLPLVIIFARVRAQ